MTATRKQATDMMDLIQKPFQSDVPPNVPMINLRANAVNKRYKEVPHNVQHAQHNFFPVQNAQLNNVQIRKARANTDKPVCQNHFTQKIFNQSVVLQREISKHNMAQPERSVQQHVLSPQNMSQYNTHSTQNTRNDSVCDRYQQNTRSNPSYFPANNQLRPHYSFDSIHHQSNYLQTNISSPQPNNYSSSFQPENGYFNILNLPNIELKTKGLFPNI